jgi:hypothetical protein
MVATAEHSKRARRRPFPTLLVLILLAAGAGGGWFWWKQHEKDRIIAELSRKLDRVWTESLVADLRVDRIYKDPAGGDAIDLTFVHYVPGQEESLFKRSLTVYGTEVYIDALVVSFERKFVESGDGLRGKGLLLFRRAFGDRQAPAEGVSLHTGGGDLIPVPEVLRVDTEPSQFERKIWQRFWQYANDPALAASAGVRVAQGEAPHIKPLQGQVYKLTLQASGGLEIKPRLPPAILDSPRRGP